MPKLQAFILALICTAIIYYLITVPLSNYFKAQIKKGDKK